VASKHGVSVYRESNLIITDLFPADIAKSQDVLLLFQGTTLEEYLTLKADQKKLMETGTYDANASREISRRFGRMLSYSPRKINKLLAENTDFRTMDDFGIRANNLFLYYKDLKAAGEFYSNTLGMEIVADYQMALILRMTHDSYLILVDAAKGMHTADEPKTVALALLTDQLDEWYDYLKAQNVNIKYTYKPKAGSAHDGFVIVDPEGYLLEIERFNQHPENEKFVPLLKLNKAITIQTSDKSEVPEGLHFHSTITWLYYKDVLTMQNFYQDVLGLEMVADQGWTKIYKVSESGFMAIVDERQGMHKFTETKAVNVGFIINDLLPWFEYVKENRVMKLMSDELGVGDKNRYNAFVTYDPESYFLEFDTFLPHADNKLLLEYLNSTKRK
jgi:catechol 2,3-dioxygenase-like lactoylglutathione lyase family enzyme